VEKKLTRIPPVAASEQGRAHPLNLGGTPVLLRVVELRGVSVILTSVGGKPLIRWKDGPMVSSGQRG